MWQIKGKQVNHFLFNVQQNYQLETGKSDVGIDQDKDINMDVEVGLDIITLNS